MNTLPRLKRIYGHCSKSVAMCGEDGIEIPRCARVEQHTLGAPNRISGTVDEGKQKAERDSPPEASASRIRKGDESCGQFWRGCAV